MQRAESREQRIIPDFCRFWERSIYLQRALDKECGISNGMPPGEITNLKDYSIIELLVQCDSPRMARGSTLTLRWDGKFVRCGHLTWDIKQLEDEFKAGLWALKEPSRPCKEENFQNFQWTPHDMVQALKTYRSSLSWSELGKKSKINTALAKLDLVNKARNVDQVPPAVRCLLSHVALTKCLGGERYLEVIKPLTSTEDISAVALLCYATDLKKIILDSIQGSYPGLIRAILK